MPILIFDGNQFRTDLQQVKEKIEDSKKIKSASYVEKLQSDFHFCIELKTKNL